MTENYDGLLWEIDEIPIGSSTPDELFEYSYRAKAECPECGGKIHGTANYWSREDDMSGAWLSSIDYEECENCPEEEMEPDENEDFDNPETTNP